MGLSFTVALHHLTLAFQKADRSCFRFGLIVQVTLIQEGARYILHVHRFQLHVCAQLLVQWIIFVEYIGK